jgi:RNA polymerase sigma-70 factor (ECF subfamily)
MTSSEKAEQFQNLIDEHRRILYKVCSVYAFQQDDRDDLAQEILVQLWRSFGSYDGHRPFSTWMYRIALNVAIDYCRRESVRRRHAMNADTRVLESIEDTESPSADMVAIYQFIGGLDPMRRALILLYLDGYSHQETAGILGISATNVGTIIGRIKQQLKQELGPVESA